MSEKKCRKCKAANISESVYCYNCGARLDPRKPKELFSNFYLRILNVLRPLYVILLLLIGFSGIFLCGYYLLKTTYPDVEIGLPWQDDEITDARFRSSEETDLEDINRIYLNAIERGQESSAVLIEKIERNSDRYNRELVVFTGEIIKVDTFSYSSDGTLGSGEDINEDNASEDISEEVSDQSLYFTGLMVADEDSSVLVVYRGSDEYFQIEDYVEITGVVNDEPTGVVATKIEIAQKTNPLISLMEDNIFYFTLAAMTWMVLTIILFLTRAGHRRKRIAQLTIAILLTSFLAGCEIHFVTEIKPNGSGTISTTFVESVENVEFLRQVPLTLDMLESWKMQARQTGIVTDNFAEGETEYFYIQRDVDDFAALTGSSDTYNDQSQWIFFEKSVYEDYVSYRYEGFIDTSTLLDVDPDLGSQVVSEMQKEIENIQIDYSLILPGEIVYHNADSQEGNLLTWEIPIREGQYVIAESQVVQAEQIKLRSIPVQMYKILFIIFILFIFLIFISLIFYRTILRG